MLSQASNWNTSGEIEMVNPSKIAFSFFFWSSEMDAVIRDGP